MNPQTRSAYRLLLDGFRVRPIGDVISADLHKFGLRTQNAFVPIFYGDRVRTIGTHHIGRFAFEMGPTDPKFLSKMPFINYRLRNIGATLFAAPGDLMDPKTS